jgi:hypothetical protein
VQAYLADGGKVDCRNAAGETLIELAEDRAYYRIARLLQRHLDSQ